MNYEGNEEFFEKELVKTTKLVELVLEQRQMKEEFLRSDSPVLFAVFRDVIVLNQILTGLGYEDCEELVEVAVAEKNRRFYRYEMQKAALEENFEKEKND